MSSAAITGLPNAHVLRFEPTTTIQPRTHAHTPHASQPQWETGWFQSSVCLAVLDKCFKNHLNGDHKVCLYGTSPWYRNQVVMILEILKSESGSAKANICYTCMRVTYSPPVIRLIYNNGACERVYMSDGECSWSVVGCIYKYLYSQS